MRALIRFVRSGLAPALLCFAIGVFAPAHSRAELPAGSTLLDYGFKGFTLGVELGLASGYIATGPKWESSEWKKLVMGAGIGALGGITIGMALAVVDTSARGPVPIGYYVLRDAAVGTLVGAAMGAIVGLLLWVNDGSSKDVLKGAAFGTYFGALAGGGYGVIEAMNAVPSRPNILGGERGGLHLGRVRLAFSAAPAAHAAGLVAVLSGPLEF